MDFAPAEPDWLYVNQGDGTFVDASDRLPGALHDGYALAGGWHDVDDDGWLDLYPIFDFGQSYPAHLMWNRGGELVSDGGRLYLVVELVAGRPLGELIVGGPLPPRRALVLARQLLDALEHAHDRGVVHRDLKPDNVLVTAAGSPHDPYDHVKVLDFGLVKLFDQAAAIVGGDRLTRTGIAFGTPAYIAPEAALGRAIDRRVDLYAVGVILFELLTGRLPFVAADPLGYLRAHVGTPPPRLADAAGAQPWVTPALEALVGGALAKAPADRFASAAVMRACLDDAFLALP